MANEILSIAVIRPQPGHEDDVVSVIRELHQLLLLKNYCRDLLYRDLNDPGVLVDLRYWSSAEARSHAHEDPDVHRFWRRLGEISTVEKVYERLEETP